ncbi:hypothetical protein [Mycetohabitans rhizoxinica]|uniref:hypothetical protein n=1 Tax=Mycetohabitans rhizoxinica TaxID=412963 RepID=UPI0030CD457A
MHGQQRRFKRQRMCNADALALALVPSNGKSYAIDCAPGQCRRRCCFARYVISDTDDDINAASNSVSLLLAVHARRKAGAYLRVIPTQF